jgi:hypothetical protein
MADEIITELWKIKDKTAQEYRFDLDALVAYLRSLHPESAQQRDADSLVATKQPVQKTVSHQK